MDFAELRLTWLKAFISAEEGQMVVVLKILLTLGVLYAVLLFGAWLLQRQLMYFPDTVRTPPELFGLSDVEEVTFQTPGGETLVSWWTKAQPGKPTLLYFHGNAGALVTRGERVRKYQDQGFGLFMMTYRGFGGSTGRPSERANVRDAKQAYEVLLSRGVAPDDIVLYGESLGTGVATQVAAEKECAGVILDAPYTTMTDVAALHYPYLPARWLMTDRYRTTAYIKRINAPLLIVHGEDDEVIPVEMGRKLFDLAKEPKQIATFKGAGHADHHAFGSYDVIWQWLKKLPQARRMKAAE